MHQLLGTRVTKCLQITRPISSSQWAGVKAEMHDFVILSEHSVLWRSTADAGVVGTEMSAQEPRKTPRAGVQRNQPGVGAAWGLGRHSPPWQWGHLHFRQHLPGPRGPWCEFPMWMEPLAQLGVTRHPVTFSVHRHQPWGHPQSVIPQPLFTLQPHRPPPRLQLNN